MGLWDIAKSKAKKDEKSSYWPHVMQLYREMGGIEKSVQLLVGNKKFDLLGESLNELPLVKDTVSQEIFELSEKDYISSQKLFKSAVKRSVNPSLVPIKKLVTRKDGTTFMQTFYVSIEEKLELEKKKFISEQEAEKYVDEDDENFWRNKTAELTVDVAATWKIQCNNLYTSNNLGALAVRESIQNSRDAIITALKKKKIKKGRIDIDYEGSTLTMQDNGIGMDVSTLHKKFLELGGTTKGDNQDTGAVGGFGQAKAVILGCGDNWEIQTRNNYLNSKSLGNSQVEETKNFEGTKLTVHNVQVGRRNWGDNPGPELLEGNEHKFKASTMEYIASSYIPEAEVYFQGEKVTPWFIPEADKIKSLSFFGVKPPEDGTKMTVYVYPKENKDETGRIYVRLNGLTQFVSIIGYEAPCDVVLDFNETPDPRSPMYPFTNNREKLKGSYENIIQAIRDTVKDNPKAVVRDSKYRETMFDNKSLAVEETRKITRTLSGLKGDDLSSMEFINQLIQENKEKDYSVMPNNISSWQKEIWESKKARQNRESWDSDTAQGKENEELTTTEVMMNKRQQIQDIARVENISEKEAMEKLEEQENTITKDDGNPLDYSWLCWETTDRETPFDLSKNLDLLVAWDSICKIILERYSGARGFVYYPGFILDNEIEGLSVKLPHPETNEMRKYVMFNPEKVLTDNDFITASHLKLLACHELAHSITGAGHDENHSYTREDLDRCSFDVMDDLMNIVKKLKIRKKIEKAKGVRKEVIKKEQAKEKYKADIESYSDIEKSFESLPESKMLREITYLTLNALDSSGELKKQSLERDHVTIISPDSLEGVFSTGTVVEETPKTVTVKRDYDYGTITVPKSEVVSSSVIEKIYKTVRISTGYDGYYRPSPQNSEGLETWVNDYCGSSDRGSIMLVNKYIQSYYMKKKKLSGDDKWGNVKNLALYTIDKAVKEGLYKDTISLKHGVLNNIRGIIRDIDFSYYYDNWEYGGKELVDECFREYFKKGGLQKPKKAKPSVDKKPKKTKSSKQESFEQAKFNAKLKLMNNDELEEYAKKAGIKTEDVKAKYPEPRIYRMRLTMAVKKVVDPEKLEIRG